MLQLGELGARQRDPPLLRAEVHKHGVVFDAQDDTEPVRVVRHLIVDGERLGRAHQSRGLKRDSSTPSLLPICEPSVLNDILLITIAIEKMVYSQFADSRFTSKVR